ncbi:hypothetical protein D9M72_370670 [compost metagenome]
MQGCFGVARHPVQDFGVGLDTPARGKLPAVEGAHGGLAEDVAGDVDGLHPFAAVLVGGEVVEHHGGVHGGIRGCDLEAAAGVGIHGADVHLVAVLRIRLLAVVPHGDGEEVEHQVGVRHLIVGADEPAALEVVGGRGTLAAQEPLEADERVAPQVKVRLHGHRLGAGVLDVDLEVVLQVLAHAGQVDHRLDAERLEVGGVPDAGKLQQLGGIDGAAGQDHLSGVHLVRPAVAAVGDAGGNVAFEVHLRDQGAGADRQVGPFGPGAQVGPGRGKPLPLVHVPVKRREALLAVAVHVIRQRESRFLCCLEEGLEQGVGGRAALQDQGSRVAAEVIVRIRRERVFHPVEVRQAVREIPGSHPLVGSPAFVVQRVSTLEDHAVDGARAAQDLAAGMGHPASPHMRLRIRLVAPVIERIPAGEGQGSRHLDEQIPGVVASSRFQNQDAARAPCAQAVGQHGTGTSPTDDDVVVAGLCHSAKSPCTSRGPGVAVP